MKDKLIQPTKRIMILKQLTYIRLLVPCYLWCKLLSACKQVSALVIQQQNYQLSLTPSSSSVSSISSASFSSRSFINSSCCKYNQFKNKFWPQSYNIHKTTMSECSHTVTRTPTEPLCYVQCDQN